MIGSVVRTDAMVLRGLGTVLGALPLGLRLIVLTTALFLGMVGCTAAWIDQQSYVPAPNVCRSDEVSRTDCVHLAPQAAPGAGVTR